MGILCLGLLAGSSCSRPLANQLLVITQVPPNHLPAAPYDAVDLRYPLGSRVVITQPPFERGALRVLSSGLMAAGDPVVSWDARRIVFAGKRDSASDWQIYEARFNGRRPRALTSIRGGAIEPALLPDGRLVFVSPAPKLPSKDGDLRPPALYVQAPGAAPRQLTFSSHAIRGPTVLSDGRILFVSTQPHASSGASGGLTLYSINNDGSEFNVFAGPQQGVAMIERPRQLADGRLAFIAKSEDALGNGSAEFVPMARPFAARKPLLPTAAAQVRSVQPGIAGELWVCARLANETPQSGLRYAAFRLAPNAETLAAPAFVQPDWDTVEAVQLAAFKRPTGRLSTLDFTRRSGQLLCLDANASSDSLGEGQTSPIASRVRLLSQTAAGMITVLGDVAVQPDGSFLAEVPADMPLGFETVDQQGQVLRRVAPMIWVRPGENRACAGCHAAPNHAPHNHRPLAVRVPVPRLCAKPADLAQKNF